MKRSKIQKLLLAAASVLPALAASILMLWMLKQDEETNSGTMSEDLTEVPLFCI